MARRFFPDVDAEEQLQSMKLGDNDDSKAHLAELKEHFQLMTQRRKKWGLLYQTLVLT
jgi:hypothetical protein